MGSRKSISKRLAKKDILGLIFQAHHFMNLPNDMVPRHHITQLKDLKNAVTDALVGNMPAVLNVEVDPKALYSFRKTLLHIESNEFTRI